MTKLIHHLLLRLYKSAFPYWIKNALRLTLSDIERYQQISTIKLPPGQRILVLAPHPDDESIGCGGTLKKCVTAGLDVRVIVLTDGRHGSLQIRQLPDNDPEKTGLQKNLIDTRQAETRAAMQQIGVKQILFLNAIDSQLTQDVARIAEALAHELDKWQPDTIILPFITDRHADHFATNRCLIQACSQLGKNFTTKLTCMGYETWSPIYANVLIDISATIQIKLKSIQCYHSQLTDLDYSSAVEGLNRYRAITGMTTGTHAEAFHMCKLPEYEQLYRQLLI